MAAMCADFCQLLVDLLCTRVPALIASTDFEAMAELVDPKNIAQEQQDELAAYLQEMRNDYNQRHFVRNETFKAAADKLSGPTRKIFIEFLERSCTAEFSGFLLFKELGRRLKNVNPVVAGE